MLHDIQHSYKATLISALNVFTLLGDIAAIALITRFVTDTGYLTGYVLFGVAVFAIGLVLWLLMYIEAKNRRRKLVSS